MSDGLSAIERWRILKNHAMSVADKNEILRVSKALIVFFGEVWNRVLLCSSSAASPVMLCYMSDGWSSFVWSTHFDMLGKKRVESWVRERIEFLSQRAVLKAFGVGDEVIGAIRFAPPCPLLHGKTSWQIFSAYTQFHEPLRRFTSHPCITFLVFDGLHRNSLTRLARARRKLFYECRRLSVGDGDEMDINSLLEEKTDVILSIHCLGHVFSLGTKWGIAPWATKDIIDSIHIGIKSCHNSSYALHDQIDVFLRTRLVPFSVRPSVQTMDDRCMVWRLLVRDPTLLEIAEESGFWFGPITQLAYVYADFLEREDWFQMLRVFMKAGFYFPDFSETRWVGARLSAASKFTALFCGLDLIAEQARKCPHHSKEFLPGYEKGRDPEVRYVTAICAIAILVSDAAHTTILADDRFLRNNVKIRQDMCDEIEYIWRLPIGLWQSFIEHIGARYTAAGLRHDTLTAALRMHGFAHHGAFHQLTCFPLKLTQGDIAGNIEALARHDDAHITDEATLQLRDALDLGWSHDSARRTLLLASDASCCTTMVEQGHGVSSAAAREQIVGGIVNLQSRSLIHQTRGLFAVSEAEKEKATIDEQIRKLEGQMNKRFRGREYVASRLSKLSFSRNSSPAARFKVGQSCVARRNACYNALSLSQQAGAELKAASEKKRRSDAIQTEIEHLRARRALVDQRDAELRSDGVVNAVKSFKLGDSERTMFNDTFKNVAATYGVDELERQFPVSSKAPPASEQELLLQVENTGETKKRSALPPWMQHICRNRDAFLNTILFEAENGEPRTAYMPIIVRQDTYAIVWLCLERTYRGMPMRTSRVAGISITVPAVPPSRFPPRFAMSFKFSVDGEIGICGADHLWVIDEFTFGDFPFLQSSRLHAVSWEHFCRFHNKSTGGRPTQTSKITRQPDAAWVSALQAEFPWLTDEDLGVRKRASGKKHFKSVGVKNADDPDNHGGVSDGDAADPVGTSDNDEAGQGDHPDESGHDIGAGEASAHPDDVNHVDLEALGAELAIHRDEFNSAQFADMFFYVRVLGGEWLHRERGLSSDGTRCYCRGGIAKLFCKKYKFPMQKHFARNLYEGMSNSFKLSAEVARRGDWYCGWWASHDCAETFRFTAEHDPEEDLDFVVWASELDINTPAFVAVTMIRGLRPTNPA